MVEQGMWAVGGTVVGVGLVPGQMMIVSYTDAQHEGRMT